MAFQKLHPGNTKTLAALALAQMSGRPLTELHRDLRRSDRRKWANEGRVRSSSSFEHSVALGVDMIDLDAFRLTGSEDYALTKAKLVPSLETVLDRSTTGRHELWFSREDGSAFISFEDHDDAVMLELALVGDRT